MQIIPLQFALSGMVLARDILREDGLVLCSKGTVLSGSLIERLTKMNVRTITVEGRPAVQEGEKTLEEELADLEERFSRRTDSPILMSIKALIKDLIVASWH